MSASHHDELHQEDYMSDKLWELMITAIEPSPTESANSSEYATSFTIIGVS